MMQDYNEAQDAKEAMDRRDFMGRLVCCACILLTESGCNPA
jgi:hypothetical protein